MHLFLDGVDAFMVALLALLWFFPYAIRKRLNPPIDPWRWPSPPLSPTISAMADPTDDSTSKTKRRFSARIGEDVVPIQVRSMNDPLRNSLWNLMREMIPPDVPISAGSPTLRSRQSVERLTVLVLRLPVEGIGSAPLRWLYAKVREVPWFTVYDLLEFIADHVGDFTYGTISEPAFHGFANEILERENAGYRFLGGILTEVTSPTDIEAVEKAMRDAQSHGFGPVHAHIKQALELLGKRPEPDYRNAIKEAISAVESAANLLKGGKKRTLDPALDLLASRLKLHPAFKSALSKLYGFTSDDSGIRHALMDEPKVDDADARFFIVACSAFVSWLIVKADQAGLLEPGS